MKNASQRMPTVVDMAYEIIDLHEENMRLRSEVEFYKPFEQMYFAELDKSIEHSGAMTGHLLSAVLDPESVISKGHKAIAAERASKAGA